MPDPLLYLKAMGAAAGVSTICALALLVRRRAVGTPWRNSACVFAVAAGLVAGNYVLSLQWKWPPANGLDRLLTLVVPLTLGIELLAGWSYVPRTTCWLLRLILIAAIPRVLLHQSVYLSGEGDWTLGMASSALAISSLLLGGVWVLLSRLSDRAPGVSIPFALGLTILCSGATVMLAGYIKGGAAAIPLAAALIATAIAGKLATCRAKLPTPVEAPALVAIGVVGLAGILLVGHFFGRLSTPAALTLLLAPLLCWLTELPYLKTRPPWLIGSLRVFFVAVPLLVILLLAKSEFDRELGPLVSHSPPAPTARTPASHPAQHAPCSHPWDGVFRARMPRCTLQQECDQTAYFSTRNPHTHETHTELLHYRPH